MIDYEDIFEKFKDKYNLECGKILGKGGFGMVREIIMKGRTYAGKLVKNNAKKDNKKGNVNENEDNNNIILFLQNPNIIKIYKIYQESFENYEKEKEIYNLIILEKANLKDLRTLVNYIYNDSGKLINKAFSEIIGNNLLIFFTKQLINGLEILERNELIHFDIKPQNILIFTKLSLKLSDFGLLREVNKIEKIRIPGGTPGYLPPDYYKYKRQNIYVNDAKKQDYFALGATLFLLKYNQRMIKVKNFKRANRSEENLLNQEYIIDMIPTIITLIKSNNASDRDFNDFLCSLIQIEPDDRPSFEEIYRNKWVNKNGKYISQIVNCFSYDEYYLMKELRKSDFLIEKKQEKQYIKRNKFIFKFKKKNKKYNNNNNSNSASTESKTENDNLF